MAYPTADPGDTLTVNFAVNNPGDRLTEQDILLTLENGAKSTVDQLTNISLNGGASGTYSLDWNIPENQTVQIYELAIESEDDVEVIWDPLGVFDATSASGTTIDWSVTETSQDSEPDLSIAYDELYVGAGSVLALDVNDGTNIWSSPVSGTVRGISYNSGYVYAGTTGNTVYKFNADDGSLVWEHSLHGAKIYGVTSSGSTTISGDGNGNLIAVNTSDGSEIWRSNAHDLQVRGLVSSQTNVYSKAGNIEGRDIADGTQIFSTGDYAWSGDIFYYKDILFSAFSGGTVALNPTNGSQIWSVDPLQSLYKSVHGSNGVIYFISDEGERSAHNYADGSMVWSENIGTSGTTQYDIEVINNRMCIITSGAVVSRIIE